MLARPFKSLLAFLTVAHLLGCSNMDSRPERADKLKPILVEVNPATSGAFQAPLWGDEVRLDFHFIAPPLTPAFTASGVPARLKALTVPVPPARISAPTDVAELPGLQHSVVHATVKVPTLAELQSIDPALAELPFLRFQYELLIEGAERSLPISGDFLAYRDASVPEAAWNFQGSSIVQPASTSPGGTTIDIEAAIKNEQNEPLRVAWFVSDGKIKNRRASSTEWEAPGAGDYTLIFTVRGKQSRSATLLIKTVTVP